MTKANPNVVKLLKTASDSIPSREYLDKNILRECALLYKIDWEPTTPETPSTVDALDDGKSNSPKAEIDQDQQGKKNIDPVVENANLIDLDQQQHQQEPVEPKQYEGEFIEAVKPNQQHNNSGDVIVTSNPVVSAQIPSNLSGGDQMTVIAPDGQELKVTLPSNCLSGQFVQIPYTPRYVQGIDPNTNSVNNGNLSFNPVIVGQPVHLSDIWSDLQPQTQPSHPEPVFTQEEHQIIPTPTTFVATTTSTSREQQQIDHDQLYVSESLIYNTSNSPEQGEQVVEKEKKNKVMDDDKLDEFEERIRKLLNKDDLGDAPGGGA